MKTVLSIGVALVAQGVFAGYNLPAFRPPAVPLVSVDPQFSVWSAADRLYDRVPEHWTGEKRDLSIVLTADGESYRLCGQEPVGARVLEQKSVEVRPNESLYRFAGGTLAVELCFLTPRVTDDMALFALPVTILSAQVTGAKDWKLEVKAEKLVKDEEGTFRLVGPIRMDNTERYLLAYDDKIGINFFGQNLKPWWTKGGVTFDAMVEKTRGRLDEIVRRTRTFDARITAEAFQAGFAPYAQVVGLAWRQSFAACKFVIGPEGSPFLLSRECGSGEMIGTTDVFYPQLPHLLYAGADYVRATLLPTMLYAASGKWPYEYAPHDLGLFPNAKGQYYGMKKGQSVGGGADDSSRMPVEECGNMLLCLTALAEREGSADFASRWWPIVTQWAKYLERTGFDPENQLCTDDFAGHLAHNANLSIKTILAIGAYARLCEMRGETAEAKKWRALAEGWVPKWLEAAKGGRDGATRLAFDKPDTWSLKYNLVWDRMLGLGLFPKSLAESEVKAYREWIDTYGVPLDNRKPFGKPDWMVWCGSLTGRDDDLHALVKPLWKFLNETPDRVPFTDWYMTDSAAWREFRGRSTVGAVMMPLVKPLRYETKIPYRGVVEGFYGPAWGHQARLDLIRQMGRWGLNTYIYGPKDDPYHHKKWTEAYPEKEGRAFQEYLVQSKKWGVHFFWALHLGDAFPKDKAKHAEVYANVFRKLELMHGLGVRAFALFFDDFGADDASLHAEICNRVKREFLDKKGDCAKLVMCPNVYWDNGTSGYCKTLGEKLDASISIIWTGPGICTDVPEKVTEKVAASYRRAPFLWWNWPVNDYCRHLLVMGRMYGVDDYPYAGFVMNPMEFCEASKQAVRQLGDWCRDPKDFDSRRSHAHAIDALYPECMNAMQVFVAHNTDTTSKTLRRDESASFRPSAAEFRKLRTAADELKKVLPASYPELWREIAPWVESFADEAELGCRLYAGQDGAGLLKKIEARKEKAGTRVLLPFLRSFGQSEMPTNAVTRSVWRNERVSAEFAVRGPGTFKASVSGIPGARVRVVRAVKAGGGMSDDLLDDADTLKLAAGERGVFVVTATVAKDCPAGKLQGLVTITDTKRAMEVSEGNGQECPFSVTASLTLDVADRTLPDPKDWTFLLDLWQHPWAVARYHGLKPFSPEHYAKLRPLLKELASGGQKTITTTLVDLPWNHQNYDAYHSMVGHRQLADGSWQHDFSLFDEYVAFSESCGLGPQIHCYSMVPWGYVVRYEDASGETKAVSLKPGTKEHTAFWGPFLDAFRTHLKEKGWLGRVYMALDERSPEDLRNTVALIRRHAPELKIQMAGNRDPAEFGDVAVDNYSQAMEYIDATAAAALRRHRAAGHDVTYYVCCYPYHPNTFTTSPSGECEWLPFFSAAHGLSGLLRWAAFNWPADPMIDSTFGNWAPGDTYLLYPDARTSVRWERLRDGIEEFVKIDALRKAGCDLKAVDALLADRCTYARARNLPAEDFERDIAELRAAVDHAARKCR